jgi:DICT domain-containing protein
MLPILESVFDRLQQALGEQVSAVSLTKASLVHLSHCAEGLILKHRLPAMIFTGFQESSHWHKETQRYRELANITKQITIFAGGKLPPELDTQLLQVTLANDDPMRQEWVLVVLSDELSLVLAGQDSLQPTKQEAERLFDVLWSFQPQAVQTTLNSLEGIVERYVPEKLPLLQAARQEYHIGHPNPDLASEFVMDLLHFESRISQQLNYEQNANRTKTFLMHLITHEFRTCCVARLKKV